MAWLPAVTNKQLECVDFHKDGGLLLAASSLTNRYWTGSLCYYEHPPSAPDPCECTAGIELDSGVRDACWVHGTNNVLAGSDSGEVSLWKLSDDHRSFACINRSEQHDSFVTAVSVNADQTRLTSTGQDCRIKIWDFIEFNCTQSYTAHLDVVWAAAWHPHEKDIFISCSQDGRTILWDVRKQKPALVLSLELASRPTCVCWHPSRENNVAFGTQTGDVSIRDTRQLDGSAVLADTRPHRRSVHRMAFSNNRPDWLASVSEDCTAVVTNFGGTSPDILHRDSTSHTDFVQGVAWHPQTNELFTCGWDYKVCHRQVVPLATVVNGDVSKATAMDCGLNGMGDSEPVSKTAVRDGLLYSDKVKE